MKRRRRNLIYQCIFARLTRLQMRSAPYGFTYSFPPHNSDQPLGGIKLILLPGFLLDTIFIEADSHTKNSRNIRPFNFSGSLTDICFNVLKSAPSTPMAKKANALRSSPS